jgi:hypothetical protein
MMKKLKMIKFSNIYALLLVISVAMSSCLPQPTQIRETAPTVDSNSSNNNTDTDSTTGTTQTTGQLTEQINFFQQGTQKFTSQINIFSDYNDSFIIRGNQLNAYLQNAILSTPPTLCLISKFPANSTIGSKEVLVMSARIRNYYNPDISGREYFLQVEVANDSANTNDCLTVNLNNTLSQTFNTTSVAYKLGDVCPNCNSNTVSDGVDLYDSTGVKITGIDVNYLKLGIIPPLGTQTGNTASACTTTSACVGQGYNCCLQGQCVNHGEVRSGVDTNSSDYLVAIQQILARPELISNYQDYFYICPMMVSTNPDNNQSDPNLDPVQQAADLFDELKDLYSCLNPVIDEFSICTKKEELVSQKVIPTGTTTFFAPNDDITYSNLNPTLSYNNIVGLNYAGIKIYEAQLLNSDILTALDPANGIIGPANDDFGNGQSLVFNMLPPANAVNDTLKIHYRVDGTCERVGSTIAKCKKFYKQGQNSTPPRSSDHPSGQIFRIPSYANTSYNVIVEIGGVRFAPGSDTWTLNGNSVVFASSFNIFNNQEITISYFVSQNLSLLLDSREEAQAQIDDHCACGEGIDCNLKPVFTDENGNLTLTSYACVYPQPDLPEPPLQRTVFMSARSVAHKFFDNNGVHYEFDNISSGFRQECAVNSNGDESTCNLFEYESENVNKPNNSSYTGFNEIYGSFNLNEKSPMPATKVDVIKGRRYDLFTDEGVFSSCLNCGTSYYSNLQKIFPNNFLHKGGGYQPDMVESRREYNQGKFNADDFKFGRACFVPATMIPWTHNTNQDVTVQRRDRLKAQHFLFANGYNKDWYGFDYGSLIGSFDGVHWFAIGNQRQIQAKSNKLYLAINAYFGDVTANNTFKVVVSEVSSVLFSGSTIAHDTDSDGAECQKAHFCSTDNDCTAQLGYDYTCQNVSGIRSSWPMFDNNGNEISGSNIVSLLSLVGGSNGEVKRCVYRSRGAICEEDLASLDSTTSYISNEQIPLHACSANTYCESLNESKFNDKIARFGDSPASQNNKSYITTKTDTLGLDARILGRPLNFYGTESVQNDIKDTLLANNVKSICIPGKSPENAITKFQLNSVTGTTTEADKILGIGRTFASTVSTNENYFSACPATGDDGNFTNFDSGNLNAANHMPFAVAQNMSTNSLNLPVLDSLNIFNDNGSLVTAKGYHKNTCLRAAGAKCFTDLDCSPNRFISLKIKTVSNFLGQMNEAEQNFWKEELVCGNSQDRYIANTIVPNPYYQIKEQRCCRETGNEFTYFSEEHEGSDFMLSDGSGNPVVPGINLDIYSDKRYSRTHTTYDKQISEPLKYPTMSVAKEKPIAPLNYLNDISKLLQYNTLHLNNSRMCCTGHWVREFAAGSNGNNGGHKFSGTKQQNIDYEEFKFLNWHPNTSDILGAPTVPYTCSVEFVNTLNCEIKTIIEGSAEEQKYLKWFGKFELLGIPQVLIETNFSGNDSIFKRMDPSQQPIDETDPLRLPFEGTIKSNDGTIANGKTDVIYNGVNYYSGASTGTSAYNYDDGNFEIGSGKLKRVFSENKFNCCLPTGIEVEATTTNEQCCTGQVTNQDGPTRCCLNDFTDLSVYTNRYVSSEGAFFNGQKIEDSSIDPLSGYIKKEKVLQMAANMCCSGTAAYGVAISSLFIPINGDEILPDKLTRRWLYLNTTDDAEDTGGVFSKFEAGMKWNDHVYCVPADLDGGGSNGGSTVTGE